MAPRKPFRRCVFGAPGLCRSCISAAEWGAPRETESKQAVDPKAALRLAAPGRGEACVPGLAGGEDGGGGGGGLAGTGLAGDVLLQEQAPKQRGWEPPGTGWGSAPASHGLLASDKGVWTSSPLPSPGLQETHPVTCVVPCRAWWRMILFVDSLKGGWVFRERFVFRGTAPGWEILPSIRISEEVFWGTFEAAERRAPTPECFLSPEHHVFPGAAGLSGVSHRQQRWAGARNSRAGPGFAYNLHSDLHAHLPRPRASPRSSQAVAFSW